MSNTDFAKTWSSLPRAARDALYNNAEAFPDNGALIEEWTQASAALRAARQAHLDLPYASGERTKWDLFPADRPEAPCLVFIHGGYWLRNSREMFTCLMEGVRAHGWSAALPGYTLAPDASIGQIVDEIGAALEWLGIYGKEHGIAGPVVLAGWSAGAQLAALWLGHWAVKAGFGISGVYELGPLRDIYVNETLKISDTEIETLSPARLPPLDKPFMIAHGTRELPPFVADARALHSARADAHCPGALVPVAGAQHYDILQSLRQPDGLLTKLVLSLV